ncbi:mechanosensitive ion channel family protein [Stappia sp.]|uniref:mechanosensitive ion channel family protein n=1 Tax=Stappia sp. TaxID=1870903 RepID=UPI003C7C2B34
MILLRSYGPRVGRTVTTGLRMAAVVGMVAFFGAASAQEQAPAAASEQTGMTVSQPTAAATQSVEAVVDDIHKGAPDLQTLLRDYPISPPDTTSPRASLESFMVLMSEASRVWRDVRDAFRDSGRAFMSEEENRQVEVVRLLISKAREIFDLSDVPETARTAVGVEVVLQFQEILDRIFLPPLDEIPGDRAGSFLHAKEASDLPERWTIPGTSIVFQRTDATKGDLKYLVSRETVDRIPDDYESVKLFPTRSDKGEDFYEYYIYTPGYLVAPRWYDLILAGPDWLQNQFMSQAYWQWAALLLLLAVAVSIPVMLQRWNRWRAVPLSDVHRRLRGFQQPLLQLIVVIVFRYLVDEQINITGAPMIAIGTFSSVVMWVSLAWLAYQSVDLLASYVTKNPAMPTASLDSSLLLSAFRLFGLAFAIITLGYGATRIGIPIYGVIAGLGVGGLAVALAAQPTLENLIGGVILYADRMVRVGEYCEFEGFAGTVEAIGIRSTRLRALDRTLITVANSDLAKRKIVNFSRRDRFLFRHTIGLRYETERDQVMSVVRQIHTYFTGHPKVLDQIALRVSLVGYGAYSVDIEIFSYISTSDRDEFLMIQEELLLEIGRIIKENGSDFAFPSNVTYLGRDAGLPGMKRGAAATQGADKAPLRGDRTDDLVDMASEA